MIETFLSPPLSEHLAGHPGLLSFAAVTVIAALAFVPRPPICLFGGLIFGFAAFPVALAGTTCGALIAFLISRHLLRSRFSDMAGRRPRLKLVVDAIDAEGWRLLGLLRLASPIPGSASNYLFGLTNIGLGSYVAATALGSAPQILAFVYLGTAGRIALDAPSVSTVKLGFTIAGCALFCGALLLVSRRVKSMLAIKLGQTCPDVPPQPNMG